MPAPFNSADLYARINQPFTDISQLLSLLQKQVGFDVNIAAGDVYGTLTAARTPTKPMVIGFIPPDFVVNYVPIEKKPTTNATIASAQPAVQQEPVVIKQVGHAIPYPPSFYQKLNQVAQAIGARPEDLLAIMLSESGMHPAPEKIATVPRDSNGQPIARGLTQITSVAAGAAGMTQDFWRDSYSNLSAQDQLPYVQKYFQTVGGGRDYPDAGTLYLANFASGRLSQANNPDSIIFSKADGDNYSMNKGLDSGNKGYITVGDMTIRANNIKSRSDYQEYLKAFKEANPTYKDPDVPSAGAVSAQAAGAIIMTGNITDKDGEDPLQLLGRNIQRSDQRSQIVQKQVSLLNQAITLIHATPALVLLVNPSSFTRNFEAQVDPVKVRRGYAIHMWLEKPVGLSLKGATAGQYVFSADKEGGLTHFNRIKSISYKNLMSLVSIYRNNGHLYTEDIATDQGNAGTIQISMSAFIYYDGHIYIGSFDDFSITDSGNKPYNLEYDTKFTVRYDIDTTQVSDANITRGLGA